MWPPSEMKMDIESWEIPAASGEMKLDRGPVTGIPKSDGDVLDAMSKQVGTRYHHMWLMCRSTVTEYRVDSSRSPWPLPLGL